jgi:hypothetical protein
MMASEVYVTEMALGDAGSKVGGVVHFDGRDSFQRLVMRCRR